MRWLFLAGMMAGPALGLLNAAVHARRMVDFLRTTPRLDSSRAMERFKELAAGQMRAALLQGMLLVTAPVCYLWGLVSTALRGADFIWILIPSAVVIVAGRTFRTIELKVWTLPATEPEFEAQRDRIVHTWKTKALPDW